jgi:hypothetical protein
VLLAAKLRDVPVGVGGIFGEVDASAVGLDALGEPVDERGELRDGVLFDLARGP